MDTSAVGAVSITNTVSVLVPTTGEVATTKECALVISAPELTLAVFAVGAVLAVCILVAGKWIRDAIMSPTWKL